MDVEDEFLGSVHHAEAVGCADCHGPSDGHIADENNEVLPDRVFTRENTDPFCAKCHECSRLTTKEATHLPRARRKICTECHGSHDVELAEDAGVESKPENG